MYRYFVAQQLYILLLGTYYINLYIKCKYVVNNTRLGIVCSVYGVEHLITQYNIIESEVVESSQYLFMAWNSRHNQCQYWFTVFSSYLGFTCSTLHTTKSINKYFKATLCIGTTYTFFLLFGCCFVYFVNCGFSFLASLLLPIRSLRHVTHSLVRDFILSFSYT